MYFLYSVTYLSIERCVLSAFSDARRWFGKHVLCNRAKEKGNTLPGSWVCMASKQVTRAQNARANCRQQFVPSCRCSRLRSSHTGALPMWIHARLSLGCMPCQSRCGDGGQRPASKVLIVASKPPGETRSSWPWIMTLEPIITLRLMAGLWEAALQS